MTESPLLGGLGGGGGRRGAAPHHGTSLAEDPM